jgi:hypothetical protein
VLNDLLKPAEPFYLRRQHPILCGLIKFRWELCLHEDGIEIANKEEVVLMNVRLYNILHVKIPDSSVWSDMEVLSTIQGSSTRLFIHGSQSQMSDYFSRYIESTQPQSHEPASRQAKKIKENLGLAKQ